MKKAFLTIMLSCLSACFALAQETVEIDNIKYYLDNGMATVAEQTETLKGSIMIPETVTYGDEEYRVMKLAASAFADQTDITDVTLPNSITALPDYCFQYCESLKSITLPESLTKLGADCFSSCRSLGSITIPVNVRSLGRLCFSNCASLKSMTCQWESLDGIETDIDAFSGVNEEAKLYVPAGTAAEYQSTEPWSNFKYIIENGTVGVTAVDAASGVRVTTGDRLMTVSELADGETATLYNAQGMMIASGKAAAGSVSLDTNGAKGVMILKAGNKSLKVNIK